VCSSDLSQAINGREACENDQASRDLRVFSCNPDI
jgi:hypothetical protein